MDVHQTEIQDCLLLETTVHRDPRGYLTESWNERTFRSAGLDHAFVQDNHTRSGRGVLRGLHYQVRRPQGKLVRATSGAVFDVVVDLRADSTTSGRWFGIRLSEDDHRQLWIPPGCAHGFLVLGESAELQYKCTDFYDPSDERVIRWNDPELGIEWPIPPGSEPVLSERDRTAPLMRDGERP